MQIRIGHGFDVHRFDQQAEASAHITIGGVRIAHSHRLVAHSDGDVLAHALCDALLGALALGDIGGHFPDSDSRYRGCDSLELLAAVVQLLHTEGWQLANADMTLVAQAPRFAQYIPDMRGKLASVLHCEVNMVSVKATTTEGLGFTGRREGIACHAVVLMQRPPA